MAQTMSRSKILFLVLLLWAAGLGAAAQFAKFAVVFTDVQALYPDAGGTVGLLLSIISFFGLIFGMTAGIFASRIGFRRCLVFALLLGGTCSLWQALLPGLGLMLVSRLIEGVSHLIVVVTAPTLIAQISPEPYRGLAMTLWSTFFGVAFALTAWFGIALVAANGLASLLAAHGIIMLVLAVALWLGMRGIERDETADHKQGSLLSRHLAAYSSPFVVAPALGWLFYTLTFVSLLTILPSFVAEATRASVSAMMPLASIFVSLVVTGILLRFFSSIAIVCLGFGLSALVILLFWVGLSPSILAVGLFATLGLVQGASFAAVPALNKSNETRALANGAMAQMGNLGNLLGTPLLLGILSFGGQSGMLIAVIACFVFGIAAHLWLSRLRAGQA